MATYNLDGRTKVKTKAVRRYLIVSEYKGYAKVETTTDDENDAARIMVRYRQEFPGPTKLHLIDQAQR